MADKHCIGGVPGNRVTPIVVAIVAAAGILMPKTSSRAITSPAGTADAIESIANVTINAHRLMKLQKQLADLWFGRRRGSRRRRRPHDKNQTSDES